jgi:proliferating cell nuclear antigen
MTFNTIIRADIIQSIVSTARTLVDECKLRADEDGITIRAVDPANVGMVDTGLGPDSMESYDTSGVTLGLPLKKFEDVLSMADGDTLVNIELDEETRKLHVTFDDLEYTLALIDPESVREEPDIPELELEGEVVLEGEDLDRAFTAADMVSDHIQLGIDEDTGEFFVSAEGDTDDVDLRMDEDDVISIDVGEALSIFSLEYLSDMEKAIPNNAEVVMEIGKEFPTKLRFNAISDDSVEPPSGDNFTTTYMLAPRIQS